MRTCKFHGEESAAAPGSYYCDGGERNHLLCYRGDAAPEERPCFVPISAEEPGKEASIFRPCCKCGEYMDDHPSDDHYPVLGDLLEDDPAPVKPSTPVTFAAVLAHHRRLAEDPRADRAWHAEAVECLVAMVNHFDLCDAECEFCDIAGCYLREARKAVEGDG